MTRPARCLTLVLIALCFIQLAPAQDAEKTTSKPHALSPLEQSLTKLRQSFPGDMAIYMKNLATGDEISLDADSVYETFSVIKLAIAAEVVAPERGRKIFFVRSHHTQGGRPPPSVRRPLCARSRTAA